MKTGLFKKNIIQELVLLCLVLIPINIGAQANIYISPSTVLLSGQTTVTIDVMIENVIDLHSYSVEIAFDNSIIHFHNAVQGPFLANVGSTVFLTNPNPVINYVIVDAAILGTTTVNGSGKLFSINFDILSAGSSSVNIVSAQLRDHNNSIIPVDWSSGEVVVPISLNVKIFLQGPFYVNEMNTTLNSVGYLPFSQPYSAVPWNYLGAESVPSGFFTTHSNIVDWILVELRTGTGSSTILERKAGFITNSGIVVSIDGVSSLYFNKSKGNYFIVVYHRNHIPIMSSSSTLLDYLSAQYNFTTSQTKAFGTNAMINLGSGIFGMFAADANGNGQVQNNDHENYWIPQNGQSGYKSADFNLNGQVQNNDYESYWVPNNGKGTQVPN